MSRGAQHSTRQLTDQQLAQQNQLISQANQQGSADRSLMLPTIQGLLASPGYTPAEQSAITQQSMGAANTAFDALRERAANRVAATNDTAGDAGTDRATRPRAGADAGKPGAAESNRIREPKAEGSIGRSQRARPDLRD